MAKLTLTNWTEQHYPAGVDWPHEETEFRARVGCLNLLINVDQDGIHWYVQDTPNSGVRIERTGMVFPLDCRIQTYGFSTSWLAEGEATSVTLAKIAATKAAKTALPSRSLPSPIAA